MKPLFVIFILALSLNVNAQNASEEIQYLRTYIQSSDCLFHRNGSIHTAKEALKHIDSKYQYYKKDIHSAERFIEKSASKSNLTGKPYSVSCPDKGNGKQTLNSQTWLLRALSHYRSRYK